MVHLILIQHCYFFPLMLLLYYFLCSSLILKQQLDFILLISLELFEFKLLRFNKYLLEYHLVLLSPFLWEWLIIAYFLLNSVGHL